MGFGGRVMPLLTADTSETPHQYSREMLSELIAEY